MQGTAQDGPIVELCGGGATLEPCWSPAPRCTDPPMGPAYGKLHPRISNPSPQCCPFCLLLRTLFGIVKHFCARGKQLTRMAKNGDSLKSNEEGPRCTAWRFPALAPRCNPCGMTVQCTIAVRGSSHLLGKSGRNQRMRRVSHSQDLLKFQTCPLFLSLYSLLISNGSPEPNVLPIHTPISQS
jgi:hypothetical protein